MDVPNFHELFASTHGVFTMAMVRHLGLAPRTVRRWAQQGRLVRLCGHAFVPAGTPITLLHRVIAIHLIWPDAIVCFLTAALLHGLNVEDDGYVHVLVPDARRALPGTKVHRWSVRPTVVVNDGLVVMTDKRTTLADCLGRLPDDDAWGLLAWTFTRDQMTEADLAAQINDRFHLYGIVRLRLMLTAVRRGALSVGELHMQDFLEECGFTGWSGDFRVLRNGRTAARGDVGFPGSRLILEFDGRLAHTKATKRRDVLRDRRINRAGYDVLHVTWAILYEHRRALRQTLRAMLAAPPRSRARKDLADALYERTRGSDQPVSRTTAEPATA